MTEAAPDLEGNAWYHITETRVNFTSAMFYNGNGNIYFAGTDTTNNAMYWQIYQLSGGNYQFRNRNTGTDQQMAACYKPDEKTEGKTQPCMLPSNAGQAQKWMIKAWGNGVGYKIQNVANGTGYNLDYHPGQVGFMSNDTNVTPNQPAQHWLFSSIGLVNDGIYSTSILPTNSAKATSTSSSSNDPASAPAATTSSSSSQASSTSPSSSGLSSGAAAGIGVGVALAVIALVLGIFLLFRRRRKAKRNATTELPGISAYDPQSSQPGKQYEKVGQTPVHEVPGNSAPQYEMYADQAPSELPGSESLKHGR